MAQYRNILIIQTAFIGDAILASSLAEKLHAFFPTAKITMLVRKGNESIYAQHPFLHEVLAWDKTQKKSGNLFRMAKLVRRNKYDCVVNCHRYTSSGIITALSGAKHTSGFKENPFSFLFNYTARHAIGDGRHEVDRLNALVRDFTDGKSSRPKLYPSTNDLALIRLYQGLPYLCMAPASVWFTKQLPAEKWIQLCNVSAVGTKIFLIGAPGDIELCNRIAKDSLHPNIEVLAGKLTLLQSCALMKGAQMNFVNDSAPLHLASASNAPVTAFFCSTVPAFGFGPLSDNSKMLGLADLPCRPCGLHGYAACPLGHFKCARLMPLPGTVP